MMQNDDVRFISFPIKISSFANPNHKPLFSSLHLTPRTQFPKLPFNFSFNLSSNPQAASFVSHLIKIQSFFNHFTKKPQFDNAVRKSPIFCSASLGLSSDSEPAPAQSDGGDGPGSVVSSRGDDVVAVAQPKSVGSSGGGGGSEERVLISEVFVRNKDGEELERKDLEAEALNALKTSHANSALTMREVQEDVHRIVASGYFSSCMPVAVDTRDGIRLIFQVEPNQEFQRLVCEGANVLPLKFIKDSFGDGYGKVVNIRRLDEVIRSINGWYMERGLFGLVSDVEILSGGIIKLQVSEAEVNNINIRYLDKTGKPTVGKTRPETILSQLTTKKGQVYSMIQGKRDVDAVLAMGVMDSVSIIPQPAGDTRKVNLTMNVVERESEEELLEVVEQVNKLVGRYLD